MGPVSVNVCLGVPGNRFHVDCQHAQRVLFQTLGSPATTQLEAHPSLCAGTQYPVPSQDYFQISDLITDLQCLSHFPYLLSGDCEGLGWA